MLTFLQFLDELHHGTCNYSDYGVIHPKTGAMISLMGHKKARYHGDFKDEKTAKARSAKSRDDWEHAPEYAHTKPSPAYPNGHLILRSVTDKNKHHVLRAYDKLPHDVSGQVLFNRSMEANKERVRNHIRNNSVGDGTN